MNRQLAERVKRKVPPQIKEQGKELLIYEVVRIVMRETDGLGFSMQPSMKPEDHHEMKRLIITALVNKHALYTSTHASVGDIITDLLEEFENHGLSLAEVVHA